jgi:hypothetical protein
MSLSNATRTVLLDPVSHNNRRCVFELPDAAYASDLVLADVGLNLDRAANAGGPVYGPLSGVLATAARVYIRSGNVVIDECRDTSEYTSYQALMAKNSHSTDVSRSEILNGAGYSKRVGGDVAPSSNLPSFHATPPGVVNYTNNQLPLTTSDQSSKGLIHLRDYLPFLESTPVLEWIPRLNIVIEWNTNIADVALPDQDGSAPAAGAFAISSVTRPTCIAQELVGVPKPVGKRQIPYLRVISEKLVVPAVAAADEIKESAIKSQAFKGKALKDLTLMNQALAQINGRVPRKQASIAMRDERIQLVVNGQKYLPDEGISSGAQKMAMFQSVHAPLNVPLMGTFYGTELRSQFFHGVADSSSATFQGSYSVTSVDISDTIQSLEVDYRRTGFGAAHGIASFNLVLLGRVFSLMEIDDLGNVRISS